MSHRIQIDVSAHVIRRAGRASWYLEYVLGGVQHRESLATSDRNKAIEHAKVLLRERQARAWGTSPTGTKTISKFMEEWLEDMDARNCAPRTIELNRYTCRIFIHWLADEMMLTCEPVLKDVTPERLQKYFARRAQRKVWQRDGRERQISPHSVNRDRRIIRSMFSRAVKKGELGANPVAGTDPLKVIRKVKPVPTKKEVIRFLSAAAKFKNPIVHDVALVFVNCGLRLNEALHLQWVDVDLKRRTLLVRSRPEYGHRIKDHEERELPMTKAVKSMLERREQFKGDNPWVFPGARGDSFDDWYFRKHFVKVAKQCRFVGLTPQSLRRAFASLCASSGMPAFVLKKLMGHANVETTEKHYIGGDVVGTWKPPSIT